MCSVPWNPGRDGTLRFPRLAVRAWSSPRSLPGSRGGIHWRARFTWWSTTSIFIAGNRLPITLARSSAYNCGFTFHYTTKHGSWLNQAELEIGLFARQCLGKRRVPDLATLKAEAQAWNRQINRKRTLINWNFSRNDARNVFHYQENLFMRSEN